MEKTPIVAFLYDFDKTLCTTDMQDYAFIPTLGMTPAEFWAEANDFGRANRIDGILAYMYTMLREARSASTCRLPGRIWWKRAGASCSFRAWRPGSRGSTPSAERQGVQVEHYIISSGLREIIEGSSISGAFKEIYASEFYYDETGRPVWPKLAVNFTAKTQFVYRINKGVLDVSDDKTLNDSMPDDSKRVPFHQHDLHGGRPQRRALHEDDAGLRRPGHRRLPAQQPPRRGGPLGQGAGGFYFPGGLPGGDRAGYHSQGYHPEDGGNRPALAGKCPAVPLHRGRCAALSGGAVLSRGCEMEGLQGRAIRALPFFHKKTEKSGRFPFTKRIHFAKLYPA